MPRSGWLAIGAVVAATLGARAGVVSLAGAQVVAIALATLAVAPWLTRRARGPFVAAGIGAMVIALRLMSMPTPAPPPETIDGSGPWPARVVSIGSPREGDQVGVLEVDLGTDGTGQPRTVLLAATQPRYPAVEPGDRIEVEGRARPRPDSDYGRYLERTGAWGTLQVDAVRHVDSVDEGPARVLERLRRSAGDALAMVLPEPEAGLAAGILIGLRDRVDRTLAGDFTTAGVSHVVAISGWNIAIVAAVIGAIAGRAGRRRRAVITALAVIVYVVFAGASPSVLRAGVMAGVVLLARETGRAGRAPAALGWAVALLLLADPALVADAGFQLSSLATAGLIAWATPITERLERFAGGRLPRWLAESLGVSFAAQAATLPIVLAAFGRLALISPLVNLAIVPIVAPAMAVGLVALAGGAFVMAGAPPIVGALLALPGWVALRLMVGIVEVAAGVPGASLELAPEVRGLVAGLTLAALGSVVVWQRRRTTRPSFQPRAPVIGAPPTTPPRGGRSGRLARATALVLVGTVTVTTGIALSRPPGVTRITVLDVGQGDAILVEGGRGGRLLIDGGPDPDRLLIELDRRIPPWDRRIDAVVLTHPHEDHVAGLALLLDRYRIGRVFEPGMLGPGPGYAAWHDRLAGEAAPPRASLAAGDRLDVDGVRLDVLWPIRGEVPRAPADDGTGINNVSIVFLGTVGSRRFLLTGDVEDGVDPRLLAIGLPQVDLLKVAHHGSRTATTEAFVAAVAPRVAIASAGSDNPYGHPAPPTLERLAAAGARVFRTDLDGSVAVTFAAEGLWVSTSPPRAASGDPSRIGSSTPAQVASLAEQPRVVGSRTAPPQAAAQAAFWCAIQPGPGPAPRPARPPARRRAPAALASSRATGDAKGHGLVVGYHRADDGPVPGRGRTPAGLPRSSDLVPRPCLRRGRRGGLAGDACRGERHPRRSSRGRGRGPPARCRQGGARGRSGPGPAAW
jgi:competence protein ComEC